MLTSVSSFTHLGIILDRRLNFKVQAHADMNKAKALLGLIKRCPFDFKGPCTTNRFFTTLAVQKAFFKLCVTWPATELGHPISLPYGNRFKLIHLPSLESKGTCLSVSFIVRLQSHECYLPLLLNELNIHIPAKTTRNY